MRNTRDLVGRSRADLNAFFSAQVVLNAYQALGVVGEFSRPPSDISVRDFTEQGDMSLAEGFRLGAEQRVLLTHTRLLQAVPAESPSTLVSRNGTDTGNAA